MRLLMPQCSCTSWYLIAAKQDGGKSTNKRRYYNVYQSQQGACHRWKTWTTSTLPRTTSHWRTLTHSPHLHTLLTPCFDLLSVYFFKVLTYVNKKVLVTILNLMITSTPCRCSSSTRIARYSVNSCFPVYPVYIIVASDHLSIDNSKREGLFVSRSDKEYQDCVLIRMIQVK